jgi:hypothetical protein
MLLRRELVKPIRSSADGFAYLVAQTKIRLKV